MAFEEKNKDYSEKYSIEQVKKVGFCISIGILGINKEEFIKIIKELPEPLQNIVLAACIAARKTQEPICSDIKEIKKENN